MSTISNEYMMEMLGKSKNYSIVILKKGPNDAIPERKQIVWEHGRRNFELREQGLLLIVCPVVEENEIRGVGVFNADKEKIKEIMDEDPGVKTGVFVYEILPVKSFAGDALV
jgi:YCII-related domain